MRVVISICPEYLKRFSTEFTDLNYCFTYRNPVLGHKLSLSEEERKRFLYFIHKLSEERGFGQDVLDQAVFWSWWPFWTVFFVYTVSRLWPLSFTVRHKSERGLSTLKSTRFLDYINQNLAENLSISMLAAHFYLSNSYLCKIFKTATGTTINRYITAKRISQAKAMLAEGYSVAETGSLCGFGDYSNFLSHLRKWLESL